MVWLLMIWLGGAIERLPTAIEIVVNEYRTVPADERSTWDYVLLVVAWPFFWVSGMIEAANSVVGPPK